MKNPFLPDDGDFKLPRNKYDLSHHKLMTDVFGRCTPVMCQEVIPGDSFDFQTAIGIRCMPTVFPVQSKIRASLSYFYVRNRTLQDNFEDMIFKTKEVAHPYLQLTADRAKKMISTGSLGDYLGVPTTQGTTSISTTKEQLTFANFGRFYARYSAEFQPTIPELMKLGFVHFNDRLTPNDPLYNYAAYYGCLSNPLSYSLNGSSLDFPITPNLNIPISFNYQDHFYLSVLIPSKDSEHQGYRVMHTESIPIRYVGGEDHISIPVSDLLKFHTSRALSESSVYFLMLQIQSYNQNGILYGTYNSNYTNDGTTYRLIYYATVFATNPNDSIVVWTARAPSFSVNEITESDYSNSPFVGSSPRIPINALPFRAYEMVMNYFFRNDVNNPYRLRGEVSYNDFIPTHGDGADTSTYDFHYHNWEFDMFTTAMQTPQFGAAPLVGLTFSGSHVADFTFRDDAGREFHAKLGVDGNEISSIVDYDKELPSANLRQLVDLVNYGVSINDLRSVNAFQRFLENVVRRGMRYRNQLKSHFGVNVDYPDIDVPQYIGGATRMMTSYETTNMADTGSASLGNMVGQLVGEIATKNIRCYCPEHGFIIGILSIVPVPIYSQTIAPYLLRNNPLDYFQSEFGKIGFVPIRYKQVTPLQTDKAPEDVFGYQRAWFDYMQNLDSVHGDFRTSLSQFYLGRTFAKAPTLGNDFVRVKPDELNNIFTYNNVADLQGSDAKILVSCAHKITALRPIPRNGTPSLE